MQLTKEQVEEFRELHRKEFGGELTLEEAEQAGAQLLRLLEAIYKPDPETVQKK